MNENELSLWIAKLQEGDERAPEVIFQQYFEQLVRLARRKIGAMPKRSFDEEDVAISAMNSMIRGAAHGRFPKLEDRDDFWKLLVTITARKAIKHRRIHFAEKRGGGKVMGESVFQNQSDPERPFGLDQYLGAQPNEQIASDIEETCKELVDSLADSQLEKIVFLKLEGNTNREIADQLDCAERTIERKIERIRSKWTRSMEQ